MSRPDRLSRLTLTVLLAAALLLAQLFSASHALQHALTHQQQPEQSAPQAHHCDLCALDIQLGSTLHSAPPALLLSTFTFFLTLSPFSAWQDSTPVSRPARGPPLAG